MENTKVNFGTLHFIAIKMVATRSKQQTKFVTRMETMLYLFIQFVNGSSVSILENTILEIESGNIRQSMKSTSQTLSKLM